MMQKGTMFKKYFYKSKGSESINLNYWILIGEKIIVASYISLLSQF